MQTPYTLAAVMLAAVAAAIFTAALLYRWLKAGTAGLQTRLQQAELDAAVVREDKAAVERDLAVERQKASRIPVLEANVAAALEQVSTLRQEKAEAEAARAALQEGLNRETSASQDLRQRLEAAEKARDERQTALEGIKDAKAKLEELLATKVEAIGNADSSLLELRARLVATETARGELLERLDGIKAEKGKLEEVFAGKAEALANAEVQLHELRARLEANENARHEQQTAMEGLRAEKGKLDEALAAKTEAIGNADSSLLELRARLVATETARDELLERLDATKAEKGKLDEAVAAKTEAIRNAETVLRDLRERLDAAEKTRGDLQRNLDETNLQKADIGKTLGEEAALSAEKAKAIDDLNQRNKKLSSDIAALQAENKDLATALATIRETLEQEQKQSAQKLQLLQDARDQMTKEFKVLAEEVMIRHSETFSKQNKTQIDETLAPLKEKIAEFQAGLQTAHTDSEKGRASLAEQIKQLTDASAKMTSGTENLTEALRGKSQTQGAWGEMILSSILEKSGLRAGEEYVVQQSHATEDGQRLRPDVIVNLPGSQRIVIDSKVSLTPFEAYVNAATEEERTQNLLRHVSAIRAQIKNLAGKEYHAVAEGSLDYVVMFIPIEGALAAALREDPEITSFAIHSNVFIASPTTLMIALRTASNVWNVERRNRNAEEIADRAGKIHDKLVLFVSDMKALGDRLTQARDSYDGAMNKLTRGRGNALRQLQQLRELGARTSKSLPPLLIDDDRADGEAAEELATTAP